MDVGHTLAANMCPDRGLGFQKFSKKVYVCTYINAEKLGHRGKLDFPNSGIPSNSWGLSAVGKVATVTLISQ